MWLNACSRRGAPAAALEAESRCAGPDLPLPIDTRFACQIFLRWPRSLVALHINPTYSLPEIPPSRCEARGEHRYATWLTGIDAFKPRGSVGVHAYKRHGLQGPTHKPRASVGVHAYTQHGSQGSTHMGGTARQESTRQCSPWSTHVISGASAAPRMKRVRCATHIYSSMLRWKQEQPNPVPYYHLPERRYFKGRTIIGVECLMGRLSPGSSDDRPSSQGAIIDDEALRKKNYLEVLFYFFD